MISTRPIAMIAGLAALLTCGSALANPAIVIDASSGDALFQQEATRPWFPASLSKLMTVFVALKAEREGRITMNTPIAISRRAASMAPSKMGFRPGTLVTLDNALKMLMVKSANDIAVSVAEGVSGSVEAFADEMNAAAASIGMRESHFVNPNGLPDARQVSSARDMAVLGRALYVYFPEHANLFDIGALQLGRQIIPTHNGMLGRYPGADGMKTGFTCAAGFNLVASATQNGRRLIVVVLGAPSAPTRTMFAATLLDRGFSGAVSSIGPALALASTPGDAPDMHDDVCRRRGKAAAQYMAEIEDMSAPIPSTFAQARDPAGQSLFGAAHAAPASIPPRQIASLPRPHFDPVPVFVGPPPGWAGPIARAVDDTTPVNTQAYAADKDETVDQPLKPAPDAQAMRRKKGRAHAPAKTKVAAAAHKKEAKATAKPAPKATKAAAKPVPKATKAAAKPAPKATRVKAAAKPAPHTAVARTAAHAAKSKAAAAKATE